MTPNRKRSDRVPGRCTTCGGDVGPRGVYFGRGGGCCYQCLRRYRSKAPVVPDDGRWVAHRGPKNAAEAALMAMLCDEAPEGAGGTEDE